MRNFDPTKHIQDVETLILIRLTDAFVNDCEACFYPLRCNCEKCVASYGKVAANVVGTRRKIKPQPL